ncbi:MAG: TIGR04551 family protein [Myxococcota bacterium]
MARLFIVLSLLGTLLFAEDWVQETSPKLNFLELNGYFRTRMDFMSRCDLGTFIPQNLMGTGSTAGSGTSGCPVPYAYNDPEYADKNAADRPHTLFGANLRLRLDPTLNVTEDIRIKGQVDILDNMVLGSAAGLYKSASYPYTFLTATQYPEPGMLTVKRAWAEIDTPAGEIRFGRMPLNWGMGVLYNSGNHITNDYGDNVDGVMFITQAFGHYVMPGFFVSYVGQTQRGGGMGSAGDNGEPFQSNEWGQRYNLDPTDDAYTFMLNIAQKDKPADVKALLADGRPVFNYGLSGSYRFQVNDSAGVPAGQPLQQRNSNAGFLSLWADYYVEKLHIEAEAVGIAGKIGNSKGLWLDGSGRSDALTILQAGVALKSRYGFMSDKLGVGLDAGWASGDSAPGMGARPGLNKNFQKGAADGPQFGGSDTSINNFRFNPDYRIDLILFREIIGTITDAFYLKPHIAYDFTKAFGARLDVVSSFTNFAESTPGQSHLLGLEFDASVYYRSEQGIYAMGQFGLLVPFSGFNHSELNSIKLQQDFGTAKVATAFQIFAGIEF